MRGLRRGRVPAQGNGAGRRNHLLSRLLAPLVSVAVLATLLLLAAAPSRVPDAAAPATTAGTTSDSLRPTSEPSTPSATNAPTNARTNAPTGGLAVADAKAPGGATTPVIFTGPVDPEPPALRAFYGKAVSWTPCTDDDTFDCGTVRVPVDYEQPGGATTTVALRRLEASGPGSRIGSLFINPGGPGGSGIEFAKAAPDVFDDAVRERYDIVGFDPRGMGQSDPVHCLSDADLDAMYAADPTPDTPAEQAAAHRAPAALNRKCLAQGGPLAARMGTEFVARDLDILRSAVGDERLNYYGVSYGTMIGALYADLFTSRVGLMVLDSAVVTDAIDGGAPSQQEVDASARGRAYDFDDVVDDFATQCGASTSCPLGTSTAAVSRSLVSFLDRLDRRPLPTGIDSLPLLTEGWARTAIASGLQEPSSWPDLVDALDAAVNDDDGEALASFAMLLTERTEDGTYPATTFGRSHLLVTCSDWPATPWQTAVPSTDVLENHPLWARVEPPATDPCTGWQGVRRNTLLVAAEPATPVLVIGNEDDRTTPIQDTQALSGQISRSRFVTVKAAGHGAYGNDNDCADAVVDGYLAGQRAPENGYVCGS
ncbi:MAG TPA: alpha/beta fold hydrolase [Terrabacter sp.]|nr:alpha/beta fold hydrolase [Terrabacter sp.]